MKTSSTILVLLGLVLYVHAMTFESWTQQHKKTYASTEEYKLREKIFESNKGLIDRLNKMGAGETTFGMNHFGDLTPAEWRQKYLSPIDPSSYAHVPIAPVEKVQDIPTAWDWRDKGAVTPVKNQEQCGSCWAFSTVVSMEGAHFLATGELVSLSEQNIVDCDKNDTGCNGGLMNQAMEYVILNGGIDTEASYPYEGAQGECRYKAANSGATFSSYTMLAHDEEVIRQTLYAKGPVSIAVDAQWWQFYLGGIWNLGLCSNDPNKLDHGVALVAYGTEGSKNFWTVKNSWGAGWGEKGYIRVIRGKNKCGIDDFAVIPSV